MFISLLRTPLAQYAPLNASPQLSRRVFPASAALTLTRSFSVATETKPKRGRPAKEVKVDGRRKVKIPRPKVPTNVFLRFSVEYYKTHKINHSIKETSLDIKRAYEQLTPEEKAKYLPTEEEMAEYERKKAEWEEKTKDAKYKAKRTGYQLYLSEHFPETHSVEASRTVMKEVAEKWSSLTDNEKAEWRQRAKEQFEERNRS